MAAGRTTAAWSWFMSQLLWLEPRTENSGTYANKAGYHNCRANLPSTDYSVRAARDKVGPADASAAGDWTFHDAQHGDYRSIIVRTGLVRAAYLARDPRLRGWREVLGQSDSDLFAEGYDFDGWFERRPDSTHTWHIHFSEHRDKVEDFENKRAMLSIVSGQSLASYQAGGFTNMAESPILNNTHDRVYAILTMDVYGTGAPTNPLANFLRQMDGKLDAIATSSGGTWAPEQVSALAAQISAVLIAAPDNPLGADDEPAIREAVRAVLREGVGTAA